MEIVGPNGSAFRCSIPGQDSRQYCFQVPRWMFDRASCERMRVEKRPRVNWQALIALRALLEDARRHRCRELSDHVEMVSTKGGHIDEIQPRLRLPKAHAEVSATADKIIYVN